MWQSSWPGPLRTLQMARSAGSKRSRSIRLRFSQVMLWCQSRMEWGGIPFSMALLSSPLTGIM